MKKEPTPETTNKTTKKNNSKEIAQKKAAETTELSVPKQTETLPEKGKKQKVQKKFSIKKLPSVFKKKYTKSSFKKKILSKLFIADDKKLISGLFEEQKFGKKEKLFFVIPKDRQFTKNEIAKLKKIAGEMKSQKGRVKWLPLILIVVIIVGVFLSTDLILKFGLQKTMEGIFGAKVTTSYVHLDYLKSSVSIKNLVVANKKEPMKNLFQFDSLIFDIDINRIFEKSFVIDEFEAAGFAIGTERKTSGALPEKKKKPKEEKESKPITLPPFVNDLKDSAVSELGKMFESYNPENILKNINNSLKTPAASIAITTELNNLVPYWQNMPKKIEQDLNSLTSDFNKLQKINVSSIKDLSEIQANVELITRTINSTKNISDSYKTVFTKLNSDTESIKKLTSNLEKAIKDDTNLATNLTSKLTSITPSSSIKFVSSSVEKFVNSLLGAYMPMIKKGLEYADTVKDYLPAKKEKEEKPKIERLPGETITWGRQKMPTVYVRKAHGSGSGFDFTINEITTNADLSGKPTTLEGSFAVQNRVDSFDAKLDLRKNATLPVLEATYFADEFPFSFEMLDANTTLEVQIKADDFSNYTLSGFANVTNANFKLPKFEPEFAYKLCNDSAKAIDSTYLGVTGSYSDSKGVSLAVSTDFDRAFVRAVSANMSKELAVIKDQALAEVSKKLSEYKKPIDEKLAEFNQYKGKIDEYKKQLDSMLSELNAKKAEFEKAIKEKTGSAVKQGIGDALKKWF